MAKNQQFAAEFRKEAVRQVTERGLKVTDVAARWGARPVCTNGSARIVLTQRPRIKWS
jgi:transposase-like protein